VEVQNTDSVAVVGRATEPSRERKSIMEKLLLSPTEAAAHLSVGRSKVYELMRLGQLRSVKIGGCRRIPRAALADLVASLQNPRS
jgi:excisionase family DNA binding protein